MGCEAGAALRWVDLPAQPASRANPIMATGRIRMAVTLTLFLALQTQKLGRCSGRGDATRDVREFDSGSCFVPQVTAGFLAARR
jgi:hypothetical protein